MTATAAWNTLTPDDANTGLNIENAIVDGAATTVLFWTYPNLGDVGAGRECPLNFYTVRLEAGLPAAAAQPIATGVCGSALATAQLLDNGDVLILSNGRLERWRNGERLVSKTLSALSADMKTDADFGQSGTLQDMTQAGHVLVAVSVKSGNQAADTALQLISLDADGGPRWLTLLHQPGLSLTPGQVWAATGGGAAVLAEVFPSDYTSIEPRNMLYLVDSAGNPGEPLELTVKSQAPDLAGMIDMKPDEVQKAMQQLNESPPESIRKLQLAARADGGFDVLLQRDGGQDGREGHFLMRLGADGRVQKQWTVSAQVTAHGLQDWLDFNVDGGKLVLLSRVVASQPTVKSKRTGYSQSVVSIIGLDDGAVQTRLLPLDLRYLQAVMDAGDAELQYVENWPGGEPLLLSSLNGLPLAVSRGHLAKRAALRINEATPDLPAFTEVFDRGGNHAAGPAGAQAQFNAELAVAMGMSPEQFEALSDEDRKLAMSMAMGGNFNAIEAQGIKQAAAAQEAATAVDSQDINAQIAATMAQARQDLPPELAGQVAAALAQVQKEAEAGGMSTPRGDATANTAEPKAATGTGVDTGVFAMTVADVFPVYGKGLIVTGRIESGSVRVGDTVCLLPAKGGERELRVEGIENGRQVVETAKAGDTPGIFFSGIESGDVSRNDHLRASCGERQ